MSDHIDGPRSIGDPSIDLSDLFAFTSPENASRTVLAANVFPSAGTSAIFSNAVNHSIVVRRVRVSSLGNSAKFTSDDQEYRFNFRFGTLEGGPNGAKPIQHGTCTFPGGQELSFAEFTAIRQALILKIAEIVEAAGTRFAAPTQLTYLHRST
jgi:Domain of unknown function (DUF4331)